MYIFVSEVLNAGEPGIAGFSPFENFRNFPKRFDNFDAVEYALQSRPQIVQIEMRPPVGHFKSDQDVLKSGDPKPYKAPYDPKPYKAP